MGQPGGAGRIHGACGLLRCWRRLDDLLERHQLHRTGHRIDGQLAILGPAVRLVMVVDIQQDVDVTASA